jgi:inner membrane protein involved in colicin E2 resistance
MIINPLNESSLAWPVLICLHIAGFVSGIGTMALVDLRLLGLGLTQKSSAQLWSDTLPWTLAGLSLVIFTGLLLFSVNPDTYYTNHVFVAKMSVLALAIVFHYTAVFKATRTKSALRTIAAGLSLTLWTLVLFGGVFIGSVGADLNNRL